MDKQSCVSSEDSELGRVSSRWINSPVLPLEILSWVGCPQNGYPVLCSSGDSELGRVSSRWITSPVLPLEFLSWVDIPQNG